MERDVEASIIPVIQSLGSSLDNLASEKDDTTTIDNTDMISEVVPQTSSTTLAKAENVAKILNSTNNTNAQSKNSLTHSQISIISKTNDADSHGAGSHLYSTPESVMAGDQKPIMRASSKDDILERQSQVTKTKSIVSSSPVLMQSKKQKPQLPFTLALGVLQLVLSIVLAALGGLVIARDAAMSMTFAGIWAGGIAGIAGSLAIMNVKAARTGFLAASLISVASGTLAASFTGIGLLRDWNVVQQDGRLYAAVNASAGLLFVLAIHLITSIISVYHSALSVCSRNEGYGTENMIYSDLSFTLGHQRVEEYINSLPIENNMKEKMYQDLMKHSIRGDKEKIMSLYHPHYPGPMLIPASRGNAPQMMYPQPIYTPNILPFPPNLLPPGAAIYGQPTLPRDMPKLHRKRSTRSLQDKPERQRRRSKSESNRHQKEEENHRAFTYTGLDRAIAENYLVQQEKSQSTSISDNLGAKCNDVQM